VNNIEKVIPTANNKRGIATQASVISEDVPQWETLKIADSELTEPEKKEFSKKAQKRKHQDVDIDVYTIDVIGKLIFDIRQSSYIVKIFSTKIENPKQEINWKPVDDFTFSIYIVKEKKGIELTIATTAINEKERNYVLKEVWNTMEKIWNK